MIYEAQPNFWVYKLVFMGSQTGRIWHFAIQVLLRKKLKVTILFVSSQG
jgi:hypothetical protein